MGLYDNLIARRIDGELDEASAELASAVSERGADRVDEREWLGEFARRHGLLARVIAADGRRLSMTEPAHAEGRVWQASWLQSAADFFFGPEGPPDLLAHEAALGPEAERDEVRRAVADGHTAAAMRTSPGSTMQVFYRAVPLPGGRVVYLARVSRRSARALYDFRFQILKLTLGLSVAAAMMAAWLGWSVIVPLRRLQASVRAYLVVGSAKRLAMPRADEIGDLSRDFDVLATRLEGRLEHTARVTADFAHDLKSPLASVTAAAEILAGEKPIDVDRRSRLAVVVGRAAQHIERSIEAMLVMARLDEQLPREERTAVDLSLLVARERDRLLELGEREIDLAADEDVVVTGVETRLEELVQNLTDNAALFAQRRIRLAVRRVADEVVIEVEDDGPGVSEGNRDKIFERFFTHRPSAAPAGSGLGLSIVRTIALAHGGDVALSAPSKLGGACFRVTLPSG